MEPCKVVLTLWMKAYSVTIQGCHYEAGAGDFPRIPWAKALATLIGSKRKIQPKELRSCTIPLLLIALYPANWDFSNTLPFKWNLYSSTFRRCYMFFSILQNDIWKFCQILSLTTFGSGRVNPSNPNIKIVILICSPYMFSIEVVARICWRVN